MSKFTDLQHWVPFSHSSFKLNHGNSHSSKFISTTVDDLAYTPSAEETARDAAGFVATGRKGWKTLKKGGEAVWSPSL